MKRTFRPTVTSLLAVASACSLFALHAPRALATPIGLYNDPMGPAWARGGANTAFASWDRFIATDFTGEVPDDSFGMNNAALAQADPFTVTNQGAGLYNVATSQPAPSGQSGDVIFGGGNNVDFTASGSVDFEIRGFTLEIKRPGSLGSMADSGGFVPMLSIDGGTPVPADGFYLVTGNGDTASSTSSNYSDTIWYWGTSLANLTETGNETFSVEFSKTASQRLIDTIQVDVGNVAVVPEPSTAMLALAGIGAWVGLRRGRPAKAILGGIGC